MMMMVVMMSIVDDDDDDVLFLLSSFAVHAVFFYRTSYIVRRADGDDRGRDRVRWYTPFAVHLKSIVM